tara:strand:+ start:1912 stop:2373 length:462 start_codon:yes stop_codon:yes gene_type:complete
MNELLLQDELATNDLGKRIANILLESDFNSVEIHLNGNLGTGKTFLVQSILRNSGWSNSVKSPTYTLCEEYEFNNMLFLHIDLYRTSEAEDILIFDLDRKTSGKKIIIIEWPERLREPRFFDMKINLEHQEESRIVSFDVKSNLFLSLVADNV